MAIGSNGVGTGIATIPTVQQIKIFIDENQKRVQQFYKENGIESIRF